ncbi:MAG: tetratricopeptide repeat protein, partial [Bacteroidia bacterium]
QNPEISKLQKLLETAKADTTQVNLMNNLSYEFQGIDPEKASDYVKKAHDLAEKINYKSGLAYAYNNMGNISRNKGDYKLALDNYSKSLQIRKEIFDKPGQGTALFGIGNVYLVWGEYNTALEYYLKSLKIFEEFKSKSDIADCYSNIGVIYYYQKNYPKTLEYWKQAIAYYEELSQRNAAIACLGNIGNVYAEENKPDTALSFFKKALKLSLEINDKSQIAASHLNIGSVYVNQEKYILALSEYISALKIEEELGDKETKALLLTNIGEVYRKQSNFRQAVSYLDSALKISKEIKSREKMKLCYKELSNTYSAAKDFEKAYQYHQLFSDQKDSLLNENTNELIGEMQTKYDTEKKEKENQILKQTVDIQELNATRQRIIIYSVCGLAALLVTLSFFIFRSYKEKKKANLQLSEKNKVIEEQHKDITDSIRYAQRIQQAILPPFQYWRQLLPNSFVLYKPKDILSGDFYWIEQNEENVYVAAADCTGHGVPGALMSLVNYNLLNKALLEKNLIQPAEILDEVNKSLTVSLHQTYNESAVRDGMDIALCAINKKSGKMQFAGAFNGGYIFKKDGSVLDLNGDKKPVGAFIEEKIALFTNQDIELQKGDKVYIFSDGYADQFGGVKGKKLKYTNLKKYIAESLDMDMEGQKNHLETRFNSWKGNFEQVDDVLVIGFSI